MRGLLLRGMTAAGMKLAGGWNSVVRAGGVLGKFLLGGTVLAGGEFAAFGKDGLVGGFISNKLNEGSKMLAEQGAVGSFHGFYTFIKELLEMFGIEGTFLNNLVERRLAKESGTDNTFKVVQRWGGDAYEATSNLVSDNPALAAGAAIAGGALGARQILKGRAGSNGGSGPGGGNGPASRSPWSNPPGGAPASAAGAADDVARAGIARSSWLSRIPRIGKLFGVAAAAGGTALVLTSDSEAAVEQDGVQADMNEIGAEVAAIGVSIAGTGAATTALAPAAASLGLRAVPGISSAIAAGDAIYDTAGYLYEGEFSKAAVRTVAGVGETISGLGGAATYLTLGTAWREAVNWAGSTVMGEDNVIGHAPAVEAAGYAANMIWRPS